MNIETITEQALKHEPAQLLAIEKIAIMESQKSFVSWFRDSSPYIHAHRKKHL